MSAAGVTIAEVESAIAAALITRVEGGLLVGGFDRHGLEVVQAKRAYGALGGRPAKPSGSAQVNQTVTPLPPSSDLPQPSPSKYQEVFEVFWAQTAKTGNKFSAHKAWLKVGRPPATAMIAAWQAYMKSKDPVDGFVQHVSTWLNERGWEQEWPEAKNVKPGANGGPSSASQEAPRCWKHRAREIPPKWMGSRWADDPKGNPIPGVRCVTCKEVEAFRRDRHVSEDDLFREGAP